MAEEKIRELNLFSGPEHRPFKLEGGQPAALLIHGFLGTPAELRPLAEHFHRASWTVEGILLPGFGSQLDTLFDQTYQDWINATASALRKLRENHQPVVLVGYSLGASIALNVAASQPPDALVLLAPFWRLGNGFHYVVWQIVRRLFPNPRLFRRANFTDARMADFIGGLIPDLDLTDPQVQDALRELRVPSRFGQQIFATGRSAGKNAAQVERPVLIVQGAEDQASKPASSRRLLNRLPGPVTYEEIQADHGLVEVDNPGFNKMVRSALAFVGYLVEDGEPPEAG